MASNIQVWIKEEAGDDATAPKTMEITNNRVSFRSDSDAEPVVIGFDNVFSSSTTDDSLWSSLKSSCMRTAFDGGEMCVYSYGDGSGGGIDTFLNLFGADLFEESNPTAHVSVSFLEVWEPGHLHDLLAPNQQSSVRLPTGGDFGTSWRLPGQREYRCPSVEDFNRICAFAQARRNNSGTKSISSHSLARVSVQTRDGALGSIVFLQIAASSNANQLLLDGAAGLSSWTNTTLGPFQKRIFSNSASTIVITHASSETSQTASTAKHLQVAEAIGKFKSPANAPKSAPATKDLLTAAIQNLEEEKRVFSDAKETFEHGLVLDRLEVLSDDVAHLSWKLGLPQGKTIWNGDVSNLINEQDEKNVSNNDIFDDGAADDVETKESLVKQANRIAQELVPERGLVLRLHKAHGEPAFFVRVTGQPHTSTVFWTWSQFQTRLSEMRAAFAVFQRVGSWKPSQPCCDPFHDQSSVNIQLLKRVARRDQSRVSEESAIAQVRKIKMLFET